ncbi:MAG: pyruvate kinase, partial [Candidatus Altiarchaeota archaeon]
MKRTKVLVTVGPSCMDEKSLKRMFRAGMNAVRINSAHGSISEYDEIISNVRKVADIPIIFDVKGPEIRIQSPADETVKR